MNWDTELDEDQRQLQQSAQDFVTRASPLQRARALRGTPEGDRPFWDALVEQGWTGLLVPDAFGGYAQDLRAAAIVADALARRLAPEPFVSGVVFGGRLIELAGAGDLGAQLLRGLAEGTQLPAVAFDESAAGVQLELAPHATVAQRSGSDFVVEGLKHHVRGAAAASGFVVSASTDGHSALYWVPRGSPGLSVVDRPQADGTQASAVHLRGVRLPASHCLGVGPQAQSALEQAFDEAVVLTSIELLALQQEMLRMSLDYMRSRKQFNKPIGAFQALQHRAVDLFIQQQLSAAVATEVLAAISSDPAHPERALMASRLKARASSAAMLIGKEAIQIHGAIGFTDEYDLGLYFQRALVLSAWLGNATVHRRRYEHLRAKARGNEA